MNLLYILFIIFVIFLMNMNRFKETFSTEVPTSIKFKTDQHIVVKPDMKLETVLPLIDEIGFLASFAEKPKDGECGKQLTTTNNLIKTNNLKGNTWVSVCNGSIDDVTLIHYLCWHKDELVGNKAVKRLMCIGIKNVPEDNNRKEFTIYIKETDCIKSKWVEYKPNNNTISNKQIFFIIYNLENSLLGLNYTDKQIYKLDETNGEWIGPINFSNVKCKRLIYDWDRHLIALDEDNQLWKMSDINWENSDWEKEENFDIYTKEEQQRKRSNFNITDLIHDNDGKIIALSNIGLLKQLHNSYGSFFGNYIDPEVVSDDKIKNKQFFNLYKVHLQNQYLMTNNDIFMNKTGIDTEKYDYIKLSKGETNTSRISLVNKLNNLIKLKRKMVNMCKNRRRVKLDTGQNMNLYNSIDKLIESLDSKGYNDL
jgi:hypothetical protein